MTKVHDFCDYIHVFNAEECIGIIHEIVRPTGLPDLANGTGLPYCFSHNHRLPLILVIGMFNMLNFLMAKNQI